jgi:methyl-accepting chemotaxis protein
MPTIRLHTSEKSQFNPALQIEVITVATIKSKIIINVIIILITIMSIAGFNYYHMMELSKMQDVGAKRAMDAVDAKEASMGGMALYQVIADAEINHELDKNAKEWSSRKTKVLQDIDKVIKSADTPEEKKLGEETKTAANNVVRLFEDKMLPLLKTSEGITPEIRELDDQIDKQVKAIEVLMDKMVTSLQKEMTKSDQAFDATIRSATRMCLIIGVAGLLLQAGLAGWLLRTIMKPVDALRLMLMDISQGEGDLTKRLDDSTRDELAEIGRYFNLFIEKLRGIIANISRTSGEVAGASGHLHEISERIATGSEEVAAQAGTVATAGEEMSATSADIAQNCQRAAESAQQASQTASRGAIVVEKTVAVMGQIASKVQESSRTVASLGARSDQIGAIIGTIEDIADQTNLLALNAAIEAARAGEQGRGFAVVADEVRALAERTTRATKEIGDMIKAIQRETGAAVTAMEQGVQQVTEGTGEAAKSGEALQEILLQINEVVLQVNQIATAAEEQTATTSEISSNIVQITEVMQQTSQGSQESATAAAQLRGNASELQRLVQQFKL